MPPIVRALSHGGINPKNIITMDYKSAFPQRVVPQSLIHLLDTANNLTLQILLTIGAMRTFPILLILFHYFFHSLILY